MQNFLKKTLAWVRLRNRMQSGKPVEVPKSEPPEWFVKIYTDYLNSDEGRRLYGTPTEPR